MLDIIIPIFQAIGSLQGPFPSFGKKTDKQQNAKDKYETDYEKNERYIIAELDGEFVKVESSEDNNGRKFETKKGNQPYESSKLERGKGNNTRLRNAREFNSVLSLYTSTFKKGDNLHKKTYDQLEVIFGSEDTKIKAERIGLKKEGDFCIFENCAIASDGSRKKKLSGSWQDLANDDEKLEFEKAWYEARLRMEAAGLLTGKLAYLSKFKSKLKITEKSQEQSELLREVKKIITDTGRALPEVNSAPIDSETLTKFFSCETADELKNFLEDTKNSSYVDELKTFIRTNINSFKNSTNPNLQDFVGACYGLGIHVDPAISNEDESKSAHDKAEAFRNLRWAIVNPECKVDVRYDSEGKIEICLDPKSYKKITATNVLYDDYEKFLSRIIFERNKKAISAEVIELLKFDSDATRKRSNPLHQPGTSTYEYEGKEYFIPSRIGGGILNLAEGNGGYREMKPEEIIELRELIKTPQIERGVAESGLAQNIKDELIKNLSLALDKTGKKEAQAIRLVNDFLGFEEKVSGVFYGATKESVEAAVKKAEALSKEAKEVLERFAKSNSLAFSTGTAPYLKNLAAVFYEVGIGNEDGEPKKEPKDILKLYEESANAGNQAALDSVIRFYKEGIGAENNDKKHDNLKRAKILEALKNISERSDKKISIQGADVEVSEFVIDNTNPDNSGFKVTKGGELFFVRVNNSINNVEHRKILDDLVLTVAQENPEQKAGKRLGRKVDLVANNPEFINAEFLENFSQIRQNEIKLDGAKYRIEKVEEGVAEAGVKKYDIKSISNDGKTLTPAYRVKISDVSGGEKKVEITKRDNKGQAIATDESDATKFNGINESINTAANLDYGWGSLTEIFGLKFEGIASGESIEFSHQNGKYKVTATNEGCEVIKLGKTNTDPEEKKYRFVDDEDEEGIVIKILDGSGNWRNLDTATPDDSKHFLEAILCVQDFKGYKELFAEIAEKMPKDARVKIADDYFVLSGDGTNQKLWKYQYENGVILSKKEVVTNPISDLAKPDILVLRSVYIDKSKNADETKTIKELSEECLALIEYDYGSEKIAGSLQTRYKNGVDEYYSSGGFLHKSKGKMAIADVLQMSSNLRDSQRKRGVVESGLDQNTKDALINKLSQDLDKTGKKEAQAIRLVNDFLGFEKRSGDGLINPYVFYGATKDSVEAAVKKAEALSKEAKKVLGKFAEENSVNFSTSTNPHLKNLAAVFYEVGIGESKKESKDILKLYEEAANAGNQAALDNVIRCYENNIGIDTNKKTEYPKIVEILKALKWAASKEISDSSGVKYKIEKEKDKGFVITKSGDNFIEFKAGDSAPEKNPDFYALIDAIKRDIQKEEVEALKKAAPILESTKELVGLAKVSVVTPAALTADLLKNASEKEEQIILRDLSSSGEITEKRYQCFLTSDEKVKTKTYKICEVDADNNLIEKEGYFIASVAEGKVAVEKFIDNTNLVQIRSQIKTSAESKDNDLITRIAGQFAFELDEEKTNFVGAAAAQNIKLKLQKLAPTDVVEIPFVNFFGEDFDKYAILKNLDGSWVFRKFNKNTKAYDDDLCQISFDANGLANLQISDSHGGQKNCDKNEFREITKLIEGIGFSTPALSDVDAATKLAELKDKLVVALNKTPAKDSTKLTKEEQDAKDKAEKRAKEIADDFFNPETQNIFAGLNDSEKENLKEFISKNIQEFGTTPALQNIAGKIYLEGIGAGLEKDLVKKAKECFFKLAGVAADTRRQGLVWESNKEGNKEAQYNLGLLYLNGGEGIFIDTKKAFQCFRRSANQNYMPAILAVSKCYQGGIGCEKNIEKAEGQLSGIIGDKQAQLRISEIKSCQDPTPENNKKYFNELSGLSSDNITRKQLTELGRYYRDGISDSNPAQSVSPDYKKAVETYETATSKGSTSSMRDLANLYEKGKVEIKTQGGVKAASQNKPVLASKMKQLADFLDQCEAAVNYGDIKIKPEGISYKVSRCEQNGRQGFIISLGGDEKNGFRIFPQLNRAYVVKNDIDTTYAGGFNALARDELFAKISTEMSRNNEEQRRKVVTGIDPKIFDGLVSEIKSVAQFDNDDRVREVAERFLGLRKVQISGNDDLKTANYYCEFPDIEGHLFKPFEQVFKKFARQHIAEFANSENSHLQNRAAIFYQRGLVGGDKKSNEIKAKKCYEKAAAKGYSGAEFNLIELEAAVSLVRKKAEKLNILSTTGALVTEEDLTKEKTEEVAKKLGTTEDKVKEAKKAAETETTKIKLDKHTDLAIKGFVPSVKIVAAEFKTESDPEKKERDKLISELLDAKEYYTPPNPAQIKFNDKTYQISDYDPQKGILVTVDGKGEDGFRISSISDSDKKIKFLIKGREQDITATSKKDLDLIMKKFDEKVKEDVKYLDKPNTLVKPTYYGALKNLITKSLG